MKYKELLDAPGCERIKDFYNVGPVQRANVESFYDAIIAHLSKGGERGAFVLHDVHGRRANHPQPLLHHRTTQNRHRSSAGAGSGGSGEGYRGIKR